MATYLLNVYTHSAIPFQYVEDIVREISNAVAEFTDVVLQYVHVYPEQRRIDIQFEMREAQVQTAAAPMVVAAILAAIALFVAVASWKLSEVVKTPAGMLLAAGLALFGLAAVIYSATR